MPVQLHGMGGGNRRQLMIGRFFKRAGTSDDAPPTPAMDAITWAYRLFFDRHPDGDELAAARAWTDWTQIRSHFLDADEFNARDDVPTRPALTGLEPANRIENVCDEEQLAILLQHVAATWSRFNETAEPMSAEMREQDRASGQRDVERLRASLARNGLEVPADICCLELGCGPGRMTHALSELCGELLAMDISAPRLKQAQDYLDAKAVSNVGLRRLSSIDDLDDLGPLGLFVSINVLQHNPPPVINAILSHVFGTLAPGGIAWFQVPTWRHGYQFQLREYLSDHLGRADREIHVLPQHEILRTAHAHGLRVVEILEDRSPSAAVASNTFLLTRDGA